MSGISFLENAVPKSMSRAKKQLQIQQENMTMEKKNKERMNKEYSNGIEKINTEFVGML